MKNFKNLEKGKNYIHVNGIDGRKTEFTFIGETDFARYTVIIVDGIEKGVKSFLVPGDQIQSLD